jgi:hypothetical protein
MDISDNSMIFHFTSLPYDILVNIVLPRLPIKILGHICSLNVSINNLCKDENLWYNKTSIDYPYFLTFKSTNSSWKEHFMLIGEKMLPLYYNGDRITFIPFNINMMNGVMNTLAGYINQTTISASNIVCVNEQLETMIDMEYFGNDIKFEILGNDNITKIVIIPGHKFIVSIPKRGRKLNPQIKRRGERKLSIYQELTSLYGSPPIYGVYYTIPSSQSYAVNNKIFCNDCVITHKGGHFFIIDKRVSDLRMVKKAKRYDIFTSLELIEILQTLQVPSPRVDDILINDYLQFENIPTKNLETNRYIAAWILLIDGESELYEKSQLCNVISKALDNIGHII